MKLWSHSAVEFGQDNSPWKTTGEGSMKKGSICLVILETFKMFKVASKSCQVIAMEMRPVVLFE